MKESLKHFSEGENEWMLENAVETIKKLNEKYKTENPSLYEENMKKFQELGI